VQVVVDPEHGITLLWDSTEARVASQAFESNLQPDAWQRSCVLQNVMALVAEGGPTTTTLPFDCEAFTAWHDFDSSNDALSPHTLRSVLEV
jgi:hypothetical protein